MNMSGNLSVTNSLKLSVLLVSVFLREAARTASKSRTNSAAAEAQKVQYLRSYPYRRYNKLILVSF